MQQDFSLINPKLIGTTCEFCESLFSNLEIHDQEHCRHLLMTLVGKCRDELIEKNKKHHDVLDQMSKLENVHREEIGLKNKEISALKI